MKESTTTTTTTAEKDSHRRRHTYYPYRWTMECEESLFQNVMYFVTFLLTFCFFFFFQNHMGVVINKFNLTLRQRLSKHAGFLLSSFFLLFNVFSSVCSILVLFLFQSLSTLFSFSVFMLKSPEWRCCCCCRCSFFSFFFLSHLVVLFSLLLRCFFAYFLISFSFLRLFFLFSFF